MGKWQQTDHNMHMRLQTIRSMGPPGVPQCIEILDYHVALALASIFCCFRKPYFANQFLTLSFKAFKRGFGWVG